MAEKEKNQQRERGGKSILTISSDVRHEDVDNLKRAPPRPIVNQYA
jgi:hypothetical protein